MTKRLPEILSTEFSFENKTKPEKVVLARLINSANLSITDRTSISEYAAKLIDLIRSTRSPSLMEHFLSEYGLSTKEGVALMCLAEAMLRVPDSETIDALIEDKIAPSDWGKHLGAASSSFVNASTWALMFTGNVLDDNHPGVSGILRAMIKRLGEPVIRTAVSQMMKEMGRQFVLGETISKALSRAKKMEDRGYTYSYDMLGEAAITKDDASRYLKAYEEAISSIAIMCTKNTVEENPGISIKLSALHPRYEVAQQNRVLTELVPVVLGLARTAKAANMGLNIDAEEQSRLILSLHVIQQVLSSPDLAGWDGFGVVVQAYGKRADLVIDWLYKLSVTLDRKIMVRLVKGAYWDTEMKLAQIEGMSDFPLFTTKSATDVSYISNAIKLLDYSDRIYPQFATHNAHSVAAIVMMAKGRSFEFQRLHGMGERLHDVILEQTGGRCRIYAPVGAHSDLLAYLVRRLLENGANSSFVNQLVNKSVSAETIAEDPFIKVSNDQTPRELVHPHELYGRNRKNSIGFDLSDAQTLIDIDRHRFVRLPSAMCLTLTKPTGELKPVINPTSKEPIGDVLECDDSTVERAISDATVWNASVDERVKILRKAADLYEENTDLLFAALIQEAGKTIPDAVGEIREAVDFLRYYAQQAEIAQLSPPRGIFAAISPWNFPLAIFTGQITAALVTGNGVIAKPAEQTPIISTIAVRLMHQAGVPASVLQLIHGPGNSVGSLLTRRAGISGVVFTGSTATALNISSSMASHLPTNAPLIAETGGLNAMIVDSTALPEQAVRDIVASAFQSAGQRCSALRCLYVQEDVAQTIIEMIIGAMNELSIGDPCKIETDIGPVIDQAAKNTIDDYIATARSFGKIIHTLRTDHDGFFVPPTLIRINSIDELEREIFGPVLHIATFKSDELDEVIKSINRKGYGLTFGLHTRIDSRVQMICEHMNVGNIYVNRNQIGAVVGTQPFGGEGLSGTGPKAGGPNYLNRFVRFPEKFSSENWNKPCDLDYLKSRLSQMVDRNQICVEDMPGPTGELNRLRTMQRGPILCLGPGKTFIEDQIAIVNKLGGMPIGIDGVISPEELTNLENIAAVIWWGENARDYLIALANRSGPIISLITEEPDLSHVVHERHICIDTTAAGGNAKLLAG
jgi:RHH-type proline utilization regulon transcriptional repressor/proline dehydrogenase/delta 1-pyrroline-5-carboxylate dehydrogenase